MMPGWRKISCDYWLVAALVAAAVAVGWALMPVVADDAGYLLPFKAWLAGDGGWWQAVTDSLRHRWTHDNARLANVVTVLMVTLPPWLRAVASGLALWLVLCAGAAVAGIGRRPLWAAAWTAWVVLALPWADQLYIWNFQVNYIWAGALMMSLTAALTGAWQWRPFWIAAAGFALGLWHEGFGVTLAMGSAMGALTCRDDNSRRLWLATIALLAGSATLLWAPATAVIQQYEGAFAQRLLFVLPWIVPTAVFAVAWLWQTIRRKHADWRMTLLLVTAVASAALTVVTSAGARVAVPSVLMSGVGLAMMVRDVRVSLRWLWTSAIAAVLTVHIVAVDIVCGRLNREMDVTLAAYRANPRATVFAPMTLRAEAPWWFLGKPYYDWFAHYAGTWRIQKLHYAGAPLYVVPERLRNFSTAKAQRIPGGPFMWWQGLIVLSSDDEWRLTDVTADFGKGPRSYTFNTIPFTSPAGGKKYVWFHPEHTWPETLTHPRPLSMSPIAQTP